RARRATPSTTSRVLPRGPCVRRDRRSRPARRTSTTVPRSADRRSDRSLGSGPVRRRLDDGGVRPGPNFLSTRPVIFQEPVHALDEVAFAIPAQQGARAAVGRDPFELGILGSELGPPERPDRAYLGGRPEATLLLDARTAPGERLAELALDLSELVVQEQGDLLTFR